MSATASLHLTPSTGIFSRLVATVDRWLMTYAEFTIRNGDIPRCVL